MEIFVENKYFPGNNGGNLDGARALWTGGTGTMVQLQRKIRC